MHTRSLIATGMVCATVVAVAGFLSNAGPLNPPAGPVAPTHKTLSEIEPRIAVNAANTPGDADSLFKISQRGSYYLTGNITGVAGKHGVEIAVGGVTLDLNGFELVGVTDSLDGVNVSVEVNNVRIRNGSVRNWGGSGVDAFDARNSALRDIAAWNNGGDGLRLGAGGVVEACASQFNSHWGIFTDTGSSITQCTAQGNFRDGIFALGSGSVIHACTAQSNIGSGIVVFGGTVRACTAQQNGVNGIVGGGGTTIIGNSVSSNQGDGILVSISCVVLNNACENNGFGGLNNNGAGIRATLVSNRIEGNNLTRNDLGLVVEEGGNLIIRNSASRNFFTNYTIAANNHHGPIIDLTAAGAPAVSGDSAPSAVATTDPWANFSF